MTRKTRQVLLALAVTTAVCADHVSAASPSLRPQVAQLAGRVVAKLSNSFRQVVTVEMPVHARHRSVLAPAQVATVAVAADVAHRFVSPFQFRLPPPVL
jgi:hypothetical protein